MRKHILKAVLAGVVSGISGLTFGVASADVVLSGQLIGAVENIRASGINVDRDGNTVYRNRTRFNDESSFVRISGLEDLGGGVQAGFQIESGFDLSGGNASGDNYTTVNSGNGKSGFGTRNTGLFFQGGFGKILFGRWDVFYDTIYLIEPDRKSLPNKISLLSMINTPTGGQNPFLDSSVGDRYNNVLSYYTPSLYGLKLQLSYVPTNESSALVNAQQPDVTFNGRIYSGTLVYQPDYFPLTVMASGFQQKANSTTTAQQPTVINSLAVNYNLTALRFGAAGKIPLADRVSLHVGVVYQPSKLAYKNPTTPDRIIFKRRSWGIPLALSAGSSTLYATYGRNGKLKMQGPDPIGGADSGERTVEGSDASFYMLGYNYDISKRTALGVYYAKISNKDQARYDFYGNGLESSNYNVRPGAVPSAVGLSFRHLF